MKKLPPRGRKTDLPQAVAIPAVLIRPKNHRPYKRRTFVEILAQGKPTVRFTRHKGGWCTCQILGAGGNPKDFISFGGKDFPSAMTHLCGEPEWAQRIKT